MTFAKNNLNPNETIALDMHPHWWYFAAPAFALVGAIAFGIFVLVVDADGSTGDALTLLSVALLVVAAIWLLIRYLRWVTTNFVITSHRVVFRTGIIAKSGIQIPLERINNVNFNQTVFERMLGAGDLLIESGGEDGQSRYTDIRHPDRVQGLIHAQMEGQARRHAGYVGQAGAGGTSVDVADQLERLEGMLERGTLTQAEFDAQKQRLLGG